MPLNPNSGCYLFPGDVTDNTQWSEASVTAGKGDRRVARTYDLGTLLPNQTKSIDLAYFLTIDSTSTTNHLNVTNLMKTQSQTVRQYFLQKEMCEETLSSIQQYQSAIPTDEFVLYPNPTRHTVTISCLSESKNFAFSIASCDGKTIRPFASHSGNLVLDVSSFENGVYFIHKKNGQTYLTKKLIVFR